MALRSNNIVKIISTATVRSPAGRHFDRRVELSPCDLRLLPWGPIQNGLLFHNPNPNPNPNSKDTTTDSLIHRLKTSLSSTLRFFPPFSGRLSRTDNEDGTTASFFVDCNNVGARFVHAAARSVSVSDILGARYVPPVVASLFPLNRVGNKEGVVEPLLAVQVTELKDGIFIGCTVNHVIADGNTFWNFLNSWSKISREHKTSTLTKLPPLRRFSRGKESPIRIPLTQLEGEHVLHWKPPALAERIFHFGKESVARLKLRANSEAGMNGRISSLQAVLAHMWRSIIRSPKIKYSEDEEVKFVYAVETRSRLQQVSEQCFGNALEPACVTMKPSEVVERGIRHVAREMNKTIGSITQEVIETNLDQWVKNPTLVSKLLCDVTRNNLLQVSNSPRFNVYGNDFGWGQPVAFRSGDANKVFGLLTVVSGVEPGSIEVQACLTPQTLQAMEKDVEFMKMVTI